MNYSLYQGILSFELFLNLTSDWVNPVSNSFDFSGVNIIMSFCFINLV